MIKFPLKQNQIYTAKILLNENQLNITNDQITAFFSSLGFANCSANGVNNIRFVTGAWIKSDSTTSWPETEYMIESWSH